MLKQIKERVKAWKRFFTQKCVSANENSSWHDILTELEYSRSSKFYASGQQRLWMALKTIGSFSKEEIAFLETLPAYAMVRLYLKHDDYREHFHDKINGVDVFSVCSEQNREIPLREYTIITDREELWGLEIYIFKDSPFIKRMRHGIIRYAKEFPADYVEPESTSGDFYF